MVQAAALQLEGLAVDAQAVLGIHFESSDADAGRYFVDLTIVDENLDLGGVEVRRCWRPEPRLIYDGREFYFRGPAGLNRLFGLGRSGYVAIGVPQPESNRYITCFRSCVGNLDCCGQGCARLRGIFGHDEDAPHGHVHISSDCEPDMAVKAGARIPAAVRSVVVDLYGKNVFAVLAEVRRQVVLETCVAVWMLAEFCSIDPEFGVHVDAVEAHRDSATFWPLGRGKRLSIPANASHHPASRAFALTVDLAERPDLRGA